jgi:glutamine synthetase
MTPKEVVKFAKEKGVRIVDLRFIDLPGLWQHFSIPMSELNEGIFEDGLGFDGSSIRGFQTIDESDMLLIPDSTTAQMDPYTAVPTMVLICNVKDPVTGKAYTRDPRYVAQKAEAYVKKGGLADTIFIGPELGVLLLRLHPLRPGLQPRLLLHRLRGGRLEHRQGRHRRPAEPGLQAALQAGLFPGAADGPVPGHPLRHGAGAGVGGDPVEVHHHEVATGGQTEIDMRYDTLTKMADQGVLVQVLREEHRQEVGQDRHLHAQAALPGQRLRHAHPPVAVEERQEPLLRARGLRGHLQDLPLLHRRHPEARAGAARLHRAVHQ